MKVIGPPNNVCFMVFSVFHKLQSRVLKHSGVVKQEIHIELVKPQKPSCAPWLFVFRVAGGSRAIILWPTKGRKHLPKTIAGSPSFARSCHRTYSENGGERAGGRGGGKGKKGKEEEKIEDSTNGIPG
jgi:hypothetical protein